MPSLKCRLKKLEHQGLLSEKDLSRIYTDNDVTEELEKIKAEMEKDKIILFYAPQKVEIFNEWIEKLDKRIAELKGENK